MAQKTLLKTDPIVAVIILLAVGAVWLNMKPGAVQDVTPAAVQQIGHIVVAEKFFDFGAVVEGEIIKHTFTFKNEGPGRVRFVKTETSCGCTTTSDILKEYVAGETGEMEVVVDTKDKKGIVVKTISLMLENNDVSAIEFSLAMQLQPPPHPKIGMLRNINTEAACKSCHLESGVGQSGVFLYHRVCAQCHGKKGVGGFAHAFNEAKWQNFDDTYLKKMIQNGWTEKGMPSFVTGVTPPLDDEQVDSLIGYIRSLVKHE